MMNVDKDFTQAWWLRCLADPVKLTAWLQKLQRTELGGYNDHVEFMSHNKVSDRERQILTNIAHDELNHSKLLVDLFADRKIAVVPDGVQSTYWDEVLGSVNSVPEYCAANYYGEALAAWRFEVIAEMPETPADIREFIWRALPDEIFHRETLRRLAGEVALGVVGAVHEQAYGRLVGAV
jgi:hypothetical protein